MKAALEDLVLTPPVAAFPFPSDASAWWAFASSCLGGLILLVLRAPQRLAEGLWLLLALACLFLASDWISSLGGKGLWGEVPRGRLWSPPGILLAGLGIGALAAFCRLVPPAESRFWLTALACGASLTAIMFLMRLESPSHDGRLLALTSLLCTLPALYLGFIAWGNVGVRAWSFWLAPALYFPVSSVFAWAWLQGLYHSKAHLTLLAMPILLLVVLALSLGADLDALIFFAYLAYLLSRLLSRYRRGAQRLPEFSDIRSLGREQLVWNTVVVAAWFLNGVAQ
jgi:hypothetical protein